MKKFYITNKRQWDTIGNTLVNEFFKKRPNGSFEVTLDSEWEKKSNPQLRYLHACIKELTEPMLDSGMIEINNFDIAKKKIKIEMGFYDSRIMRIGEIPVTVIEPKSFAKASKKEMSSIIEFVIKLGAEMGIILPDSESFKLQNEKPEVENLIDLVKN